MDKKNNCSEIFLNVKKNIMEQYKNTEDEVSLNQNHNCYYVFILLERMH